MSNRRRAAREAAWESIKTNAAVVEPRVRNRKMPSTRGGEMAANTWDDSQWSPEEVAEAESIVQAHKTRLPATVAADHASKWDGHYTVNVRNYNDRRYL